MSSFRSQFLPGPNRNPVYLWSIVAGPKWTIHPICTIFRQMAIPPTLKYRAHQESSPKFGREEREARDDVKTGDNGMSSE